MIIGFNKYLFQFADRKYGTASTSASTSTTCSSPTIHITTSELVRNKLPIRSSLEVAISYDSQLDDVFTPTNTSNAIRETSLPTCLEESGHNGTRKALENIKTAFKELSPKNRRRKKKAYQRSTTDELTFLPKSKRPFSVGLDYKNSSTVDSDGTAEEKSYYSDQETYKKTNNRRSSDEIHSRKSSHLMHKTGLMSSLRNLFQSSKPENSNSFVKVDKLKKLPAHKHGRQSSDSLIENINYESKHSDGPQHRRSTLEDGNDVKLRWKTAKSRKQDKPVVMLDSTEPENQNTVCLLSSGLITVMSQTSLEFEVSEKNSGRLVPQSRVV